MQPSYTYTLRRSLHQVAYYGESHLHMDSANFDSVQVITREGRTVLSVRSGILRESARVTEDSKTMAHLDEPNGPKKMKSSSMCDICLTPKTDVKIHCNDEAKIQDSRFKTYLFDP